MQMARLKFGVPAALALALALAACGSSSVASSSTATSSSSQTAAQTRTAVRTQTTATPPPALDEMQAAERPLASQFPATRGRSLEQLGALVHQTAQLTAATGTFTPGRQRFAFGLTVSSGGYVYAPTAVYIAPGPHAHALGPFTAAADPMGVEPQYRSEQNAGPNGIKAIYETALPLAQAGTYDVLALTVTPHGLIASPGEIAVAASSPIPAVGQRPPAITTETLASVHGDVGLLTTRTPPEQMHSVSFNEVLGKRPIALLFSTPALCVSRVCGPVTDIAVQLQHEFGNRITFIHQEIYLDNDAEKGFRPQMKAFHLETEPWLFVVNREGVITARIEGAFGLGAMTAALRSALE